MPAHPDFDGVCIEPISSAASAFVLRSIRPATASRHLFGSWVARTRSLIRHVVCCVLCAVCFVLCAVCGVLCAVCCVRGSCEGIRRSRRTNRCLEGGEILHPVVAQSTFSGYCMHEHRKWHCIDDRVQLCTGCGQPGSIAPRCEGPHRVLSNALPKSGASPD